MRNLNKKSKRVIIVAAIVGLASAGAAYSYWSVAGSGSTSAGTGTVSPITVNQTSTLTGLYPGGPAVTLSGTFNNGNPGAVYVTAVTAALGTLPGSCLAADFTIGGTATVNANIASGATSGAWTGLTIQMNNTGVNQNGCKASTIPLVLTSN